MNPDRYICCDERRRVALLAAGAPANVSGIDYVEVLAGETTADPTFIDVFLVKPLPLPLAQISAGNVRLTGGVRYRPPVVIDPIAHQPGGGTVSRWRIVIPGNQLTDFSTYRLEIVAGPGTSAPPPFLDPRLNGVEFSFKLDCPAPGDCLPECGDGEEVETSSARFDYRTRDYEGFRAQLLDRLAELVPGFEEDDPVDLTTTIAEVLAYRADQLSYRLDWAGTEAFLTTARSRAAVSRHARLMDYALGEGASARCLVSFTFEPAGAIPDGQVLPAATPLLPRIPEQDVVVKGSRLPDLLPNGPVVFETAAEIRLWKWRNAIRFHTWSDDECRLQKGSTATTLEDGSGGGGGLTEGDFLILAETRSPATGAVADARPDRRHAVRVTRLTSVTDVLDPAKALVTVEWDSADALPFDLVLQSEREAGASTPDERRCALVYGNIAFCDHGLSLPPPNLGLNPTEIEALRPTLVPPTPTAGETWRPSLEGTLVSRPLSPPENGASAAAWLDDGGRETVPALLLEDDFSVWKARGDLLRSDRFDRHFVLETALDGALQLRFGDNVNGLAPTPGHTYAPRGRFGSGVGGNIGHDTLYHVVVPDALSAVRLTVTNPLPAVGGEQPETLADARINAPQAFREQERAVTEADYAAAALKHPAVANARAVARWTGAWQTMMVYLDLLGGREFDAGLRADISAHMERFRLIGFDIIYRQAKMAPLELVLHVCAKLGHVRGNVARRVRNALRPGGIDGRPGFFHPDNFSFAEPLYISRLVAFVMALEGVASVQVTKLERIGWLAQGELATGVLVPGELEILQLNDDPSFPEQGLLRIDMGGGDG